MTWMSAQWSGIDHEAVAEAGHAVGARRPPSALKQADLVIWFAAWAGHRLVPGEPHGRLTFEDQLAR
jgi:hypothetical protein